MKKSLAIILILSVFSLLLCSCDTGKKPGFDDDDDWSAETTDGSDLPDYSVRRSPSHNLTRVDATENFDLMNFDSDDPWGAHQNLRMANGSIHNYFTYYSLDAYNNRVNENLSNVSMISRPIVMEYPADEEGYVIYEISYSQIFPISTKEYGDVYTAFFSYHGVGFLDYYTGTTYPTINLSTQIDSYSVHGDVIFQGSKYRMSCYEFREQEVLNSNVEQAADGAVITTETIKLISTTYFIVPEGYDGIVMFVYVADDSNKPLEDVLAEDNPYFTAPGIFGDDEDPNDYVFIGINAPQ